MNVNANEIGYVLISQNKDVALTASGTVTATANGFIYLGSQDNLQLNTIVAGSVNDPANVRVKTQGEVTNAIGSVATVGSTTTETVNFGSSGGGTITLTNGTSWSSLGLFGGRWYLRRLFDRHQCQRFKLQSRRAERLLPHRWDQRERV